MRIRLDDSGVGGCSYFDGRHPRWEPGEEREIGEAEAAYLLSTFPGVFYEVKPPARVAAPAAPAVDRMEHSPKQRAKRTAKRKL